MAEFLERLLQPQPTPRIKAGFPRLQAAAESATALDQCAVGWRATLNLALDAERLVQAHLVVQIAFESTPGQEHPQPPTDFGEPHRSTCTF